MAGVLPAFVWTRVFRPALAFKSFFYSFIITKHDFKIKLFSFLCVITTDYFLYGGKGVVPLEMQKGEKTCSRTHDSRRSFLPYFRWNITVLDVWNRSAKDSPICKLDYVLFRTTVSGTGIKPELGGRYPIKTNLCKWSIAEYSYTPFFTIRINSSTSCEGFKAYKSPYGMGKSQSMGIVTKAG